MCMHFHIITLFPEVCRAYTDASVLGRAQKADKGRGAKTRGKKIAVSYYNPRDFAEGTHKKTDDRPYGGGPGMVMLAEPIIRAVHKAVGRKRSKKKVLIMSPRGKAFDQTYAQRLATECDHVVLIAGRYEGIDARVKKALNAEEVSMGPYVLTGGELPALAIVDAISRHVPGVLGASDSLEESRDGAHGEVYTRPDVFTYKGKRYRVPDVLAGGHHGKIEAWRASRSG